MGVIPVVFNLRLFKPDLKNLSHVVELLTVESHLNLRVKKKQIKKIFESAIQCEPVVQIN